MKHYTFEQFIEMNQIPDDERFDECEVCNGEGDHECECGDVHECSNCHGAGKIDNLKIGYDRMCKEEDKKWEEWHKYAAA